MKDEQPIIPGVTHERLAALLERHQLGPLETVAELPGGEVNPMLLVNGALVVRFNRRDPELPKLAKEALIYRRLRRATDVPCPEVLALDTERDLVPFDALVLSYIDGMQGNTVWPELNLTERERLSEELGRICATIHTIDWPVYGELGASAPGIVQSPRWIDVVVDKIYRVYEGVARHELVSAQLLDGIITTLNDGDSIFNTAAPPVLTHTELGLWNVVLRHDGARWHVAAIVDWEWAIAADAAWEFVDLWSDPTGSFPLPESFFHGYRERKALPLDLQVRQRLYRLLHHFEMILVCFTHFKADPDRMELHRTTIKRLLTPR